MKTFLLIGIIVISATHAYNLNCPPLESNKPTTIADLRPNDVSVVMAIGDSITAGFGIDGIEGGLEEIRGASWSIGGNSGSATIANFLKYFNPDVQGASIGEHIVELCYDEICPSSHYPELDKLNAAQSGAYAQNLPAQVQYLYDQIKANPNIDINNDWKVLTVLIGANNLCLSCFSDLDIFEAANIYEENVREAISMVQKLLPRTFVSIVEIFNVSQVYDIAMQHTYCRDMHRALLLECVCAYDPIDGKANREKMDAMAQAYNAKVRLIAKDIPNTDEFAIVYQPTFSDGRIPNIDWLSDLDCFHPSRLAHQGMAINLWNNMLSPAAKKLNYIDPNAVPICPTNTTLLYTY